MSDNRFDFSDAVTASNGSTTFVTPVTTTHMSHTEMVIEYIRSVGHPVSRSEVMTGLSFSQKLWSSTIRTLLSSGAVVQHGTKKGAKYSLA